MRVRERERHNELSVGALRRLQPANLLPCTRQLFLCHINKEMCGGRGGERTRARESERERETRGDKK